MPEVESYSRRAGTQMGFFITEPNRGDYLIKLKTKRKRTTEEVIDDIRTRIEAQIPALTVDFGQVIGDMLGDLMSSTQPIEIKLFGNDTKQLEEYSQRSPMWLIMCRERPMYSMGSPLPVRRLLWNQTRQN